MLLAQGHGCKDFDGMCHMNLKDHSESIHKTISNLEWVTEQLQQCDEGDCWACLHGSATLALGYGLNCSNVWHSYLWCVLNDCDMHPMYFILHVTSDQK